MVRSELLRAKSLHAEVAYLKDLQRVGEAKRREQHQSGVLKQRELQFWSEAISEKLSRTTPTKPPSHQQVSFQLERMRQAHANLKSAHENYKGAAQSLQNGITKLSTSQKRIEILEQLLSKAQRMRANQVESRLSEDVADLVTTSRTISHVRAHLQTSNAQEVLGTEECRHFTGIGDSDKPAFGRDLTAMTGSSPSHSIHAPRTILSPTDQMNAKVEGQSPHRNLEISNVTCTVTEQQPRVSLQCQLGNRGAIALHVTRAQAGGVKVLIDPSATTLGSGVLRERHTIQNRLQAMGINVKTIEIGSADDTSSALRHPKKSPRNEDDDENYIS